LFFHISILQPLIDKQICLALLSSIFYYITHNKQKYPMSTSKGTSKNRKLLDEGKYNRGTLLPSELMPDIHFPCAIIVAELNQKITLSGSYT